MSNNIDLKKGLNIPIKGKAALKIKKTIAPDVVAVKPTDFKGFVPRLLVKEGDRVLSGSPVLADKTNSDILLVSPVSGIVQSIVRGEKRKLESIIIKADEQQEKVDFGVKNVEKLSAAEIKDALLKSGLWLSLIERPYGIVANPSIRPKAIFVSAFNTAPLAADTEFALGSEFAQVQVGVNAIAKLTDGGVHISLDEDRYASTPFHKLEHAILHTFSGKHPAGNVGVQISHLSPIRKGETIWTITPLMLSAIGKLFTTGKYNVSRKIAITGPAAIEPAYVEGLPGMSMKDISEFYDNSNGDIRFVSGDCLSGINIGSEGFLGFHDNQITLLREEKEREILGWAKPFRFNLFSSSKAYFSWLLPNKKYEMGTNMHGGVRAFVLSDVYAKVLPMDIFPVFLIKACLAGDIDKMEQFGIYEVLPEDFALCEYVDPSKNEIQSIIQNGIDLMIKEMA